LSWKTSCQISAKANGHLSQAATIRSKIPSSVRAAALYPKCPNDLDTGIRGYERWNWDLVQSRLSAYVSQSRPPFLEKTAFGLRTKGNIM